MPLLRLARRSFLLWFGAFFLCFGVVFLFFGARDASRESRYQKQGVSVNAVVVSKSLRRASREGNTSTRYEIAYRFRTDDGRTIDGVDAVSVEEWERLEPGRPFAITYLPDTPEASRAEGAGGMGSPLVMAIVGTGFALVGGVIVWITGRRLLRHWRLLRVGQSAHGVVIAIEPTNVSVNRRRQWELRYRYQDHLGRSHEGTSGAVPPSEVEGFAVEDPVDIRFDRERAEQSIWVPPSNAATAPGDAPTARARRPRSFWRTVRF